MRHRITIALCAAFSAVAATLFLPFLAGSANAEPGFPCETQILDTAFGQSVQAFCQGDPEDGTYQVIARCSDNVTVWTSLGTPAVYGEGPSVATCQGALLFPAHVLTYHVVR